MTIPINVMFLPRTSIIASISNALPASVVTTTDHKLINGLIVRIDIPEGFGMEQANQLTGVVTVIDPTTFAIDINTQAFEPFAYPSPLPSAFTPPQVVPIGEIPETVRGATQNVLPGSSL